MKCMNVHHIGVWADDIDEMVSFLTKVLGFRLLTRPKFDSGGRVFVQMGDSLMFEVLTKPEIRPRPDVPAHMAGGIGSVVGIPHVCFRVTALPAWEEKIRSLGYTVNHKAPDQGYTQFELGSVRAIWFTGPSGVDFELFEFEDEYPIGQLRSEE
jgi:catechol 2,3-dioxygenase-like lactoylglutathione lyase family enzyme